MKSPARILALLSLIAMLFIGNLQRGATVAAVVNLVAWDIKGYGDRRRRPRHGTAPVITPPTTLQVLQAGYSIQLDETLRQPAVGSARR